MALTIRRGDHERIRAEITPYTAASAIKFTAKRNLSDADAAAIISKSVGSGIEITSVGDVNTPAVAIITVLPANTQALSNNYDWTLYYDLVDGSNHTLDSGELIIQREVRTTIDP
jgi:hypothetical protein